MPCATHVILGTCAGEVGFETRFGRGMHERRPAPASVCQDRLPIAGSHSKNDLILEAKHSPRRLLRAGLSRDIGSGIWELGSGIWELGSGSWDLGSGIWELGSGSWELGSVICGGPFQSSSPRKTKPQAPRRLAGGSPEARRWLESRPSQQLDTGQAS